MAPPDISKNIKAGTAINCIRLYIFSVIEWILIITSLVLDIPLPVYLQLQKPLPVFHMENP